MALLFGTFPLDCLWPFEVACRERDGETKQSAGGCPWLSPSVVGGGFWCQETQELGPGKLQFLDIL